MTIFIDRRHVTHALLGLVAVLAATHTQASASEALVAQVLQANPGLQAQHALVRLRQAEAEAAGRLDDPRLQLGLAPDSIGVRNLDTGVIVGLQQRLPWPGRLSWEKRRAQSQLLAGQASRDALALELALATRQSYARWRYLRAAVQINVALQTSLQTLAATAEGNYAAGRSSQQDAVSAHLRVLRLREHQWQLEADQSATLARLNQLRHRAPDTPLPTQAWADDLQDPPLPQVTALMRAMLAQHPGLQRSDNLLRAARADEQLARLARRPDFQVSAQHLGTLPREEYRGQVGIAVPLPWSGSKYKAREAAATARSAQLAAEREDLTQQYAARLHAAYAAAQSALRREQLYRQELLPLAEQGRVGAIAAYARGEGDIQAAITAHTDYLDAELGRLAARRQAIEARAQLAWLAGGSQDQAILGDTQP